ncbi:MAG: MFS transporter [Hyphomicrobiales bacterium]
MITPAGELPKQPPENDHLDRREGFMAEGSGRNLHSVIACNIGVMLEGFDFIAYNFFTFIIIKLFFPTGNDVTALMLAFATFGLSYVIRPFGGIFWGIWADTLGRRSALVWISISMAVGVAILALTPSYATIGIAAPILITLARLLQGFSAGGEFASATSLLVEYAPPGRKALYSSTQMVSQVVTVAATILIVLLLTWTLSPQALESYGWRAVFVVGILIGPVGLYMRSKLAESPEFADYVEKRGGPARTPLRDVFRHYPWQALCMAGIIVIGSASFYLFLVFLPVYSARELKLGMDNAQIATLIGCLIQVPTLFVAAWLADRYGRRTVLLPASIAYAIISYPLLSYLIGAPSFTSFLIVQCVANVLIGLLSGPLPAMLSELFPTQIRSSGIGIIYNLTGAIFGGLGPFFITSLTRATGDKLSPAYWALITGLIGAAAIYCLRYVRKTPEIGKLPDLTGLAARPLTGTS